MGERLECRIVLTYWPKHFEIGMFDPVSGRYEPLGNNHPIDKVDKIVGDLRNRMEMERHIVTYSEVSGPR